MASVISLKLTVIGNSLGVVLQEDAVARLRLEEGDTLYLTEAPDGYRLTSYSPEFDEQMAEARRIMQERRAALRTLAK